MLLSGQFCRTVSFGSTLPSIDDVERALSDYVGPFGQVNRGAKHPDRVLEVQLDALSGDHLPAHGFAFGVVVIPGMKRIVVDTIGPVKGAVRAIAENAWLVVDDLPGAVR